MIIFVDTRSLHQNRVGRHKRTRRNRKTMTATPTNGNSCFPFALNCRLTKTFFGVPRKCSHCGKMIMLTAGYACQFCRYRCHKRCTGDGPHPCVRPKICSLSRLPSGDEQLFNKLLRENEINSNDIDLFTDGWASLMTPRKELTDSALSAPEFPTGSRRGSVETLTSAEPESPGVFETDVPSCSEPDIDCSTSVKEPTTVVDRIWRLWPWNKTTEEERSDKLSVEKPLIRNCTSVSPIRTPVDDFNHTILEELFQKHSTSSASSVQGETNTQSQSNFSLLGRRLNWVRYIVGGRVSQSQDCVTDTLDPTVTADDKDSWPEITETADKERLSSTWPLSGLHINHCDSFDGALTPTQVDDDQASHETWSDKLICENSDNNRPDLGEWAIPYEDLEFNECVLEGRSVQTFRGKWHGEVMIHKYKEQDNISHFIQDVHKLTKIRHENIALFMGATVEPPNLTIITSIRKGDSLYEAVHVKKRRLSHHSKVNIAKQIAQGIGYLHAKNIVLKCLNSKSIYLEGKVKVCTVDYGGPAEKPMERNDKAALCRYQLTYLSPQLMSTLRLEPPNVVVEAKHTKESDVYAFGTVLYEMFACDFPLSDQPAEAIIWMIGSGQRQRVDSLKCHVAMKSLIEDCWSPDPSYRPTFAQILRELQQTAALHKKRSSSDPEHINRTGLKKRSPHF